jgi:hypothetical protein
MPITTEIDDPGGYALHTFNGKPTVEEILDSAAVRVKLPGYRPEMPVIWDLRNVDLTDFSTLDIRRVASGIFSTQEERGSDYKVALVADDDLAYGLSRMYAVYADQLPLNATVFRTMEEALEWIR